MLGMEIERIPDQVFEDPSVVASIKITGEADQVIVVEGEVQEDHFSGGLKVRGNKVLNIAQARAQYATCIEIRCDRSQLAGRRMGELSDLLKQYHGDGTLPIRLRYQREDAVASLQLAPEWAVQANDDLLLALMDRFGGDAVRMRY